VPSSAELAVIIKGQNDLKGMVGSVKRDLNSIEKAANSVTGSIKRAGETAAGFLFAEAATQVAGLGASVIRTGIGFNSMKEQAQIAFTTMLGSGNAAKLMLDELEQFAARTPFEFPDLVQASQRMLAMGFTSKQVLPTLTAVGDAVAAMGGGSEMIDRVTRALGQMQAKGKVSAEEMLQLTEAGIPAWQNLADKIGVTVPEAMKKVEKGAVSARIGIDAQIEGINAAFGGMMEKQSQTFAGMLSNLKDTFTRAAGEVLEPFFNVAKDYMKEFVDSTGDDQLHNNLVAIQLGFLDIAIAIENAGKKLSNFIDDIGGVAGMIGKLTPTAFDPFSKVNAMLGTDLPTWGDVIRRQVNAATSDSSPSSISSLERERARIRSEQWSQNSTDPDAVMFREMESQANAYAETLRKGAEVQADYNLATDDAAEKVRTLTQRLNDAQNALFGGGTREELNLELEQAKLQKRMLQTPDGPGREALERQSALLQKQSELMQVDNRIQQTRISLADQGLLTERQQSQMTEVLINRTRDLTAGMEFAETAVGRFAEALGIAAHRLFPAPVYDYSSGMPIERRDLTGARI